MRLLIVCIVSLLLIPFLHAMSDAEEGPDTAFQKGVAALRDGDPRLAEQAFRVVLQGEPGHAMAHFHLGDLLFFQGRLIEAEDHLTRALEIAPFMVSAALRLSEVHERKGDMEKAIKILETVSPNIKDKSDPVVEGISNRIENLRRLQTIASKMREGIILFRSEKAEEAERLFREVLVLQPKDPEIHRLMGVVSGKQGRFEEAIEHFRTSLDLKPDLNESRKMLVELYFAKDELDAARVELEKALLFIDDPAGPEALLLESKLNDLDDRIEIKRLTAKWMEHDSKKQIDAAIVTLQEIIKIDPNHVAAYLNLGNLLAQKEQYDLAETFLKKALEIDPDYTEAHQRLGQVYEVSRLFRLAQVQYEKGLATPRGKASPMKALFEQSIERNADIERQSIAAADEAIAQGRVLLEAGDLDQAILMYERAVFFHPENLEARFQLALLYEQKGQLDRANFSLRLLIASNPEFAKAQHQLAGLDEKGGFFYQALKRRKAHGGNDAALEDLEKKVDEIASATQPLMERARAETAAGKPEAAIEILTEAQVIAPDDARIWMALGRMYTQVGKNKEAFEALNAAGFFEPSDGQANYFLGELYEKGKQWRDAEAQYEKALKSEHISAALRIKAEQGLRRVQHYVENQALAERYLKRGRRYQLEEDHHGAIESYEKAIGLVPDQAWGLYWTGWSYERLSDLRSARNYYRKVLNVNPSHSLALQRLGFVSEAEGKIEDAIRFYRQNLELWNGQENEETEWIKKRLSPLEKRYFFNINQVLLSYDSNPARSDNPDPDIRSSIGIGLTYLLKKDKGLQIPIGFSSDNTFFFESNTIFSQETFRISAIRSTAPFVYSIGYNYQYGLARGGATGFDHVGILNLSRFLKHDSAVRFAYIYDVFISAADRDFDATRQTFRLTYDKRWEKKVASLWYQFLDNNAKLNDQASQSNGLGFSMDWYLADDFHASLSYDISSVNFDHIDSQGNKRRENLFHSATLDASYRLQQGVVLQASYTEQRNSSNLSAGAVTIEQQLSGQSSSLGDYSQRLIRMNINWSF